MTSEFLARPLRSYEDALIDAAERLYQRRQRRPVRRLLVSVADDGQIIETQAGGEVGSVVDLATERGYAGTILLEPDGTWRALDLSDHAHQLEAERAEEYENERKRGPHLRQRGAI